MVRHRSDSFFRYATGFVALLVIVVVVAIGFELTRQSMLSIQKFGLGFWKGRVWDPVAGEFGALPFIWGTLYSSILAMLIATPIALGIAIFLNEVAPRGLRHPLAYLTELLAAIPSIVYGLWGVFALVPIVRKLEVLTPERLKSIPLFQGPPLGVGMLAAALILAVMVVPFSSSVAREILKSVPTAQREAAFALGATKWEAIRVALSYGRTGIIGAVMLGFGRALAGETAPLLFTSFNNRFWSTSLSQPIGSLTVQVFTYAVSPYEEWHRQAWAGALVLVAMVLVLSVIARFSTRRLEKMQQ